MPCLDTDFIVGILRKDKKAVKMLKSLAEEGSPVSTTIINVCELYKGIYLSEKIEENRREVESMLKLMKVLDLTKEAAKIFGETIKQLSGEQVGDLDTLIASIVLVHGETLITKDKHFKRIPDLQIRSW
jgi:predicted nucleic acid-binding protein